MELKPQQAEGAPDINGAIMARGPEFVMGLDVQRLWATGAQIFMAADNTLLVFREQNMLTLQEGGQVPVLKNVASMAMPTPVARELHKVLGDQLAALDGTKS